MAAPIIRCCLIRRHFSVLQILGHRQQPGTPIAFIKQTEKPCACLSNSSGSAPKDTSADATKNVGNHNLDNNSVPYRSRALASTMPPNLQTDSSASSPSRDRLGHLMQMYEDFVGLTVVKLAQEKVVNAEQKFLQVQEDRRAMQQELLTVQAEVRAVGAELEKTSRTDSRYIDLVKKEHEILLVEKEMSNKIKTLDKAERDFFALLSAALRESHEKERSRAEKTKYWSIIGSVIGAIIGIVGSTFNNMKRMKELRSIITESGQNADEYKAMATSMLEAVLTQHSKIEEFVQNITSLEGTESIDKAKLTEPLFVNYKDFREHTDKVIHRIEKQSDTLANRLQDIQQLLSIKGASESEGHVVYVGPELEHMLQRAEEKLQGNLKRNTWVTTAAVSSVMTLGLCLIVIFTGNGSS